MYFAIGGLGGSGTRVVAQLFIERGIFMGDDLNASNDNLLFTRLFKNPEWYRTASLEEKRNQFQIFEKSMSLAGNFLGNIWGWKEPNTHLYLTELAEFLPDLKYIHVIRHGLDMAYSDNKAQLFNWGNEFGVEANAAEAPDDLAVKNLEYWIRANRAATDKGDALFGNRFYLLNYDKLCENPKVEIKKVFDFLDIPLDEIALQKLALIPKVPASHERYRKHDISLFSHEQLDQVRAFGFTIKTYV
jgi:hypothetical protein